MFPGPFKHRGIVQWNLTKQSVRARKRRSWEWRVPKLGLATYQHFRVLNGESASPPTGGAPWVPPWVLQNGWSEFPEFLSSPLSSPESLPESLSSPESPESLTWRDLWCFCNVFFFARGFSLDSFYFSSMNFLKSYYLLSPSTWVPNLAFPLSYPGCAPPLCISLHLSLNACTMCGVF